VLNDALVGVLAVSGAEPGVKTFAILADEHYGIVGLNGYINCQLSITNDRLSMNELTRLNDEGIHKPEKARLIQKKRNKSGTL